MPTYEYRCQKCGHQFEEIQGIKAEPLARCPQKGCRGKVKRLISTGGGLLFKGSGFYATDYRSEGYKSAAKADGKDGKPAGSEGTAKSEAKTESTAKAVPAVKE
jgi:putative FmdB family regulatory protein